MHDFESDLLAIESAAADFQAVNGLAETIDEQNRRPATLEEIEDPDFRAIAHTGMLEELAEEQPRSFAELTETAEPLPYDQLARTNLDVAKLLDASRAQLREARQARAEAENSDEAERIRASLEQVRRLSPRSATAAEELAVRKLAELSAQADEAVQAARLQTRQLVQTRATLNKIYGEAGKAWPVPEFVHIVPEAQVESAKDEASKDATSEESQKSPAVDAAQETADTAGTEQGVSREIAAPEVARNVALFLTSHVGQIVQVEDLIPFIFSPEAVAERSPEALRRSITTALGVKGHGPRIQALLAEEDLFLQPGLLQGTVNGSARRIYRAVAPSIEATQGESVDAPMEVAQQAFVSPPYVHHKPHPDKAAARVRYAMGPAIGLDADKLASPMTGSDEEPASDGETAPEPETATPVTENVSSGERVKGAASVDPGRSPRASQEAPPARPGKWEEHFRRKVGQTIKQLDERDLIFEGVLRARDVGRRAASRRLGTASAVEKMAEAGLADSPERNPTDTELTAAQVVIMAIQHTSYRELGKNQPRQERAVALVEAAVNKALERKRQQRSAGSGQE